MKDDIPTLTVVREKVCPNCGGKLFEFYGFPKEPMRILLKCPKCKVGMEMEVILVGPIGRSEEYGVLNINGNPKEQ